MILSKTKTNSHFEVVIESHLPEKQVLQILADPLYQNVKGDAFFLCEVEDEAEDQEDEDNG